MKIYKKVYQEILLENILEESKNEAIAKWGSSQDVLTYIELFMNKQNGIRLKVAAPYNNIDYWHSKRTFADFKDFIDNFQSVRQIKNEKKMNLTITDDGLGKLVRTIKDYEIWYVGSAFAAKQLGRFYKGISTKWCISTDNAEYYWNNDHKNDTFYFLIKQVPENNEFDKLAVEFKANGLVQVWDLKNRKNTFNDNEIINYIKENFGWIDKIFDSERYFRTPNLKIVKNENNTVNVYGNIYLDDLGLNVVPWKDKYVINELFGDLNCNYNNLKNLENFPKIIHGDLNICDNQLESDSGSLKIVEGNADFSGNVNCQFFNIKVNGYFIK